MTKLIKSLGFLALSLVCGLLSTGCRSMSQPASASFASVTINGKTAEQILGATMVLFGEQGYQASAANQGLIFQKEGSRANTSKQALPAKTSSPTSARSAPSP